MTERKVWIPPVWDDPEMWNYKPVGPFRVGDQLYGGVFVITSLQGAVRCWSRNFRIPTVPDLTSYILDANDAVVLGNWLSPEGYVAWVGVAEAYRTLAQFHDPLEVACWEFYASGVLAQVESEFPT